MGIRLSQQAQVNTVTSKAMWTISEPDDAKDGNRGQTYVVGFTAAPAGNPGTDSLKVYTPDITPGWSSPGDAIAPPATDLRLLSSVQSVGDIPTGGVNLIIVAAVQNVLHFRVFDANGRKVVDTDETKLTEQARQIEDLRKQLVDLWLPHQ